MVTRWVGLSVDKLEHHWASRLAGLRENEMVMTKAVQWDRKKVDVKADQWDRKKVGAKERKWVWKWAGQSVVYSVGTSVRMSVDGLVVYWVLPLDSEMVLNSVATKVDLMVAWLD